MDRIYFVRYGIQRYVGRFAGPDDSAFRRGEMVVVKSLRGRELGEILAETSADPDVSAPPLHVARPEDFEQARSVEADRPRRLSACETLLGEGHWPLELIDVEPLLDDARTVIYYLGPHKLDTTGLSHAFRHNCGLDTIFQPIGRDEPAEDAGCGSCGEGGGCGSGCGEAGGGCSGCAVKELVSNRGAAMGQ